MEKPKKKKIEPYLIKGILCALHHAFQTLFF